MDESYAIDAIISRTYYEKNVALGKLQVEDGGREVASLQGHIAGYKELLQIISDEFIISPGWLMAAELRAEEDVPLCDMSDEALAVLAADAKNLIENSEAWGKVLSKIESKTNQLKNDLFFKGHATRDIDISQGMYHGMTIYEAFFGAIDEEVESREKAKKEKGSELPFDSDGPAGEPGYSSAELEGTGLEPSEEDEENEGDGEETTRNVVAFEQSEQVL